MNNNCIISAKGGARTFLGIIPCLFFFTSSILAQTATSYNANSIPITAGFSTAFGWGALSHNTTIGSENTASGYHALYSNTDGGDNTANGANALYLNTTGVNNTAHGAYALYSNTGSYNTATGESALFSNTYGYLNTASGFETLYSNTTGINNTAHGAYALFYNTTSSSNTANGYYALLYNASGSKNTAVGDSAGFHSLGNSNVFIGYGAGASETGSNKMYIGNDAAKTLLYGDFSSGQVLLGKPNATGYVFRGTRTLNVLGGILTDSMRLAPSNNWADHVFNKDYSLKPLKELEQYISINKHLPGIPSASEVKASGVNVGDMETKLLEKIEELTLYILQQQKQIEELKREVKHSK